MQERAGSLWDNFAKGKDFHSDQNKNKLLKENVRTLTSSHAIQSHFFSHILGQQWAGNNALCHSDVTPVTSQVAFSKKIGGYYYKC